MSTVSHLASPNRMVTCFGILRMYIFMEQVLETKALVNGDWI